MSAVDFLMIWVSAIGVLLADINTGKVDVVVVYKIDRLTRSLADFAKLVETFDARSSSFVAVIQQFNTTTSTGRLTLNVLLSSAQFERELASERVKDKIVASLKKGKWTGGTVPLGYELKDRKLAINRAEAKTVQTVFKLYLKTGSLKSNTIDRPKDQSANDAPLTGKLFDDRGNRMGTKPYPEKRRPIPLLLQHGVAGPERFTLNPPPQMPGSNTFLPGHRNSVRIALV